MLRRALIALTVLYQAALSPLAGALGARCRFHPSCSEYAREALERLGLATALYLTARRLLRCGPWSAGGVDPVPTGPIEETRG